MPIPFNRPIKPVAQSASIVGLCKGISSELVAWSYCGLYKNESEKYQPNVLVGFRALSEGKLSDELTMRRVPLTSLGKVRLGSIWKDDVCKSMVEFDEYECDVDFRAGGWKYCSFGSAGNAAVAPYPASLHQLPAKYAKDRNWFLEFRLKSGGKLVVPCLEFFSRCYGRSQELPRILATYPWKGGWDTEDNKLYAPIGEPEEDLRWKVKLRRRLNNGDTTFLAHAKYDDYTDAVAKSIHQQIEELHRPESTAPIFLQIPPWFQGMAKMRVRGFWFEDGLSFLALQVMGGSDPDGILIQRDRDNTNKTNGVDPFNDKAAWEGVAEKKLVRPPDIVDLTNHAESEHGAGAVELLDFDYVVLGKERVIVDSRGEKVTRRSGDKVAGSGASAYSGGEALVGGRGIGYASMHARPVIESKGALMDMWNALVHTQKAHPERVTAVEWFTFDDGYKGSGSPGLIGLSPFGDEEESELPTITRNWLFRDVSAARVRGVMIARLIVDGKPVHFVELERRPRTRKDENEQRKDAEESFKGFVVLLQDASCFPDWLRQFLSQVRYVRGIVQKLMGLGTGKAGAFSHKSAKSEAVPCAAAVLNALKKVGIDL